MGKNTFCPSLEAPKYVLCTNTSITAWFSEILRNAGIPGLDYKTKISRDHR